MEAGPAVYHALRSNVELLCLQLSELEAKQEALLESIGKHRRFLNESDLVAQALGESRIDIENEYFTSPRATSSLAVIRTTMRKLPSYHDKCTRAKATMASCESHLKQLQRRVEKLRIASTAAAATFDASSSPLTQPLASSLLQTNQGHEQRHLPLPLREVGTFAYRVVYRGGVAIRRNPMLDSPSTGDILPHGAVFWASERLCPVGSTGEIVFVRLCPAYGQPMIRGHNDITGRTSDEGAPYHRGWVFEAKTMQAKGESVPILERISTREAQRLLGEDQDRGPSTSPPSLPSRLLMSTDVDSKHDVFAGGLERREQTPSHDTRQHIDARQILEVEAEEDEDEEPLSELYDAL